MKRSIIIFNLILVSFIGYGQSDSLPGPEAYFSAIIVSNIDSSIIWYTSHFGFEVLNRVELEEKGIKQANLRCGNILIE